MKKYIFIVFCLICSSLSAQKTNAYLQYGLYPYSVSKNYFLSQRIQAIDKDNYYLIIEDTRTTQFSNCRIDSIVIGGFGKGPNKGYMVKTKSSRDQIIVKMFRDSLEWVLVMSPTYLKTKTPDCFITNTLSVGEDLLLFNYFSGDSMRFIHGSGKVETINIPDTSGYTLFRINKTAQITFENYFPQGRELSNSRLLWASDNKYAVLFPYKLPIAYPLVQKSNLIPDTQLTAMVLQFDFGNKNVKNSMSGTLPVSNFLEGSNTVTMNNFVLLAGTYDALNTTAYKFPWNPAYKLNSNSIVYPSKPINFNRKIGYIYWMKLDMEKWTVDDVGFALHDNKKTPIIKDGGILRDGYWFMGNFDSVATATTTTPLWKKANCNLKSGGENSIFTYNPISKSINTSGFPNGTSDAYSDGDSLLFLVGNNSAYFPTVESVDFDPSINNKYTVLVGSYVGEFKLDGSLVWARNDNLKQLSIKWTVFASKNGSRYASLGTFSNRGDLDFGFRSIRTIKVGDAQGSVAQMSKAPICDFDIDTIMHNHIVINYRGALNAQYYYKFGDGSLDSNLNQRYFMYNYKNVGTYIVSCIAKNSYGSDTAFYEVVISDIVSAKKLTKNTSIRIYPNPTSDFISWDLPNTNAVEIFNLSGERILKSNTPENSLNIQSLPSGIYIVAIHGDEGSFYNKILKL